MSKPTRIIDAHQHVFWLGRDDRGLAADLDAGGIELAWLLSWEIAPWEFATSSWSFDADLNPMHFRTDGTHAGIPLSDLMAARANFPTRFVVGYCPHPMMGDAPGRLKAAVEMHDVRVCGEWKFRLPFDDPRCLELFAMAGELKVPVVLHLDVPYLMIEGKRTFQPSWYGGTVANLERALQACPKTIFIGHAPGFWRELSGDADSRPEFYPQGPVEPGGRLYRLFDTYPNLYADLSAGSGRIAIERDSVHARVFLEQYANRLLFGRDNYEHKLHAFLETLDLPFEVSEAIYWKNAAALLEK